MNILYVSTLKRRIAPDQFASRERIIYVLAHGMAQRGHKVSLLGTADSHIDDVEVIPVIKKGWIDLPPVENPFIRDIGTLALQTKKLQEISGKFDIIHSHTTPDFFPSILERYINTPIVVTLHAVAETYLADIISHYPKTYFVSLSRSYRNKIGKKLIYDIVYNGVDTDLYAYKETKQDYLLWVGRLSPAKNEKGEFIDPKGVKWAIALARHTGSRLKLTGTVHSMEFFKRDVEPYLNEKIEWIGALSGEQKLPVNSIIELMQHAKAFLMTVNQEEPFGLVMAEAQSCGTPVIGWNRGSVPEIIKNGQTGFIVDSKKGLLGLTEAYKKINRLKPADCRENAITNFSLNTMIQNYEILYEKILTTPNSPHYQGGE